jgi:DNA helicase-2/ATP-dependent DNA helicase PcrA
MTDLNDWGLTDDAPAAAEPESTEPPKIHMVIGPPGCGKTTFLSEQCRRAVAKHGAHRVLVASLTRAAAAEVAGRDTGLPDEAVGTLHAHCYRTLDRPDLAETPEGITAWNSAHPNQAISRGANQLEDTLGDTQTSEGGGGDSVHHQVMTLRARMIDREHWTLEQRSHDADWEAWKAQTKRLDFTDLIERVIEDDERHPAMPKVLLVDEAQDCSLLELELIRTWSRHLGPGGTTVLVGDPDQAIYQWRGADPRALQALELADTRVLEQSYRVPAAVHAAAVQWVRQIPERPDIEYHPVDSPGNVDTMRAALRSPAALTPTIRTELDEGRSVMVLASCAYMLTPLISALRRDGVPFHNPYRKNDGRWNPMRAANRLKTFLRADPRVWGDDARCWTWDDLRTWTDPLSAKDTMTRGSKTLIETRCHRDRFGESQADDEVPMDRLMQIFDASTLRHPAFQGDIDWWEANLRSKEAKTAEYPLRVLRQQGHQALRDEPRLIVGTIHSVKGGEADTVILAPDLSVQGYWHGWHPGGPGKDQIIRMFYVALTRARDRVIVLQPSGAEHVRGLADAGVREAIAA